MQGAGARESLKPKPAAPPAPSVDLRWVWTEVRKRVFIKVPFSRQVADIMEASTPIILDEDHFVVGLPPNKFPLSSFLTADQVKNTIEAILQQAAGRRIHFEVIEGTSAEDWQIIRQRRERAAEAVVAMAQQTSQIHHYEDVLNQIAGEIRGRVSATRDRNFPQVRAQLLLDFVPLISDASDMLFTDPEAHEARRILARTIDRIASFLEIHAMTLAIEIERYRREHSTTAKRNKAATEREAPSESTNAAATRPAATRPAAAQSAQPVAPRTVPPSPPPSAPPAASQGAFQQTAQQIPSVATPTQVPNAIAAGNVSTHQAEAPSPTSEITTAAPEHSAKSMNAVDENNAGGEISPQRGSVDAPSAPRDT
jgi:hypothetical protein